MKAYTNLAIILGMLLLVIAIPAANTQASRGEPGSMEFGYGASISLNGPYLQQALEAADNLGLDWISVDLNWSLYDPETVPEADWSTLDQIINHASAHRISVMLSITQAPEHVITKQGPDPEKTAELVSWLVNRYPGGLNAIELFPGANTLHGWGTPPDPQAYAKLLSIVQAKLAELDPSIILILGGLQPLASGSGKGMNDLDYLQGIYDAGIGSPCDVISVQLSNLTDQPLTAPDPEEHRILRHYEEIRQIMLKNQHENGLIWITHLNAPSGKIKKEDRIYRDPVKQAEWLVQAYTQLRAQLYIGAAFFESINPVNAQDESRRTLLIENAAPHPFLNSLRNLIAENAPDQAIFARGRPKGSELVKRR